jgi:hypothetical protein
MAGPSVHSHPRQVIGAPLRVWECRTDRQGTSNGVRGARGSLEGARFQRASPSSQAIIIPFRNRAGGMGLVELFLATLVAGISLVNAAVPVAAFRRTHEPRFWLVAAGNLALSALGMVWVWGALPVAPPSWTLASWPTLALAAAASLLLLGASLVPRRT